MARRRPSEKIDQMGRRTLEISGAQGISRSSRVRTSQKRKQLEAAPINCVPASVPVDQLGALTVIPLPGGRAEGW
jgi:hypothetical protein